MNVSCDWTMDFDEERFVAMQSASFRRLLARPSVREDWEVALAEATELAQPLAAWDAFPLREILHERVILQNGTRIGGGPVTTVVSGAEELVVGVCTVGAAISERAAEHQCDGQSLRWVLLDELGSWGVDQVRQQLCRRVEREAAEHGLRVSASLSPGESAWTVDDQKVIFSLLDTSPIGVTLSPSLIMHPLKSLSLIIGRGSQPMGVEGMSNCDFCSIRDRCAHRLYRGE